MHECARSAGRSSEAARKSRAVLASGTHHSMRKNTSLKAMAGHTPSRRGDADREKMEDRATDARGPRAQKAAVGGGAGMAASRPCLATAALLLAPQVVLFARGKTRRGIIHISQASPRAPRASVVYTRQKKRYAESGAAGRHAAPAAHAPAGALPESAAKGGAPAARPRGGAFVPCIEPQVAFPRHLLLPLRCAARRARGASEQRQLKIPGAEIVAVQLPHRPQRLVGAAKRQPGFAAGPAHGVHAQLQRICQVGEALEEGEDLDRAGPAGERGAVEG